MMPPLSPAAASRARAELPETRSLAAAPAMSGADCLIEVLSRGGVRACFANPGTSELHLVAALDRHPEIRCLLTLFEGVATGAADGFARMAGTAACTLLHLGPGLANGLANLHNAMRARSPMINLVGQHPQAHLALDPPLAADIEAIARPYSGWQRTVTAVESVGADAAAAIQAACTPPGTIATLIVPADAAWNTGATPVGVVPPGRPPAPSPERVAQAAAWIRRGARTALVLGGAGLYGNGLAAAGRIARRSGAALLTPYPLARLERGGDRPYVERIPYPSDQARVRLGSFDRLLLIGCARPVAYFARPGESADLVAPGCEVLTVSSQQEDSVAALEMIADRLPPLTSQTRRSEPSPLAEPSGPITLPGVAAALAAVLPADAIVVDESMTSGRQFLAATRSCPPHDWLANTGGSIGIALPLAVGAAVACPDRRVLCLSAEGSGMFTAQALWTMARSSLDVTVLIFNNRRYGVLYAEWAQLGLGDPGTGARSLLDLNQPPLNWMGLAQSMGVPACRAESLGDLVQHLRRGLQNRGPCLVEVLL